MVVLGQRVTPQVYNLYYSAARPALALQFCHQKFARSEQETDDKGSRIKLTFFFRNFSSSSTYIIIIFQRKYLGKSMLIMMMSTLLALLAWTFKIPLHHMWVVPTSSELAGSKKNHSSNLLPVSSWEKKRKL